MKIVHIGLTGPVTDGWNYQDNMLSKYHVKNGHDVTFITLQWVWGEEGKLIKFESSNYYNEDGVKMIRLPIIGKDEHSRKFKRYYGLLENIRAEKPDILFVHNVSFLDSSIVAKYCKENSTVRLFIDNHTDFSNSATNWISKNILHGLIWKHYAQKLNKYACCFYGVLPARVDFLENIYGIPHNKCELLVMGADDELVQKARKPENIQRIRSQYNISENDFLIMSGGKIDNAKKQTLFLMEALRNIKNDNIKLIVFGSVDDELKEEVSALTDGNIVQYIGWVNARDSYNYFSAADLVVFPGRHSVFWEQVAGQGKPMICKLWKGTTHIDCGGNVFFCDATNADDLMMAIKTVMDKDKFKKMKQVAEKNAELFLYSKIAEKSIRMKNVEA